MKITCKDCKRTWTSLGEHMDRECTHDKCKLLEKNVAKNNKPQAIVVVPRAVKIQVSRKEVPVQSFYDKSEDALFIEVPKAIVVNINVRGTGKRR